MIETHADILKSFGNKPLADALGTTPNHIRTMRARNSIPLRHWPKLIEFAAEQGRPVTHEVLAESAPQTSQDQGDRA